MIRVEHLVKLFGRTRAVDDISFHVQKGEVVGFLGPNGAGKTTTLRVLTCFHPASSGTAEVAGHDVQDDPVAVRMQIGYLPENVPIYPDLRVEEYLFYRAALKAVPKRSRRSFVESAMERCGVLEVRRKLVGQVSRGYRQRVGLADALVARPPILILDEPTSGLDPNQRRRMKLLVRELASEHTILFSSHILSEVQDVSSRIMIIHQGKIRADGTPSALLATGEGQLLVVCAAATGAELGALLSTITGLGPVQVVHSDATHATLEAPVLAPHAVRSELGATPSEPGAAAPIEPGAMPHSAAPTGIPGDPRDQVFALLHARGIAIRELKLVMPTLEDFFQRHTEGGATAAELGSSTASAATEAIAS